MKKFIRKYIKKIILFLEDIEDRIAISRIDYSKGEDFEEFAKKLGI